MTTYQKLINGDRFSIRGRRGVYRIDIDNEIGFQGVEKYEEADADPSFEGLANIADCQLICESHLMGMLVSVKVPLIDIDFEELAYDDVLPF